MGAREDIVKQLTAEVESLSEQLVVKERQLSQSDDKVVSLESVKR